jgi:hypothetical protein
LHELGDRTVIVCQGTRGAAEELAPISLEHWTVVERHAEHEAPEGVAAMEEPRRVDRGPTREELSLSTRRKWRCTELERRCEVQPQPYVRGSVVTYERVAVSEAGESDEPAIAY